MGAKRPGKAGQAALVGVLSGISLLLLAVSDLSPVARLGLVALAGLVPAAAVVAAGVSSGFFCYGAAGLLGLLLLPDKGNALLYLGFFGLYPVLKSLIEGLGRPALEWICKLAVFDLALGLGWLCLREVLLLGLPEWLSEGWILWLVGNIAFVAYDYGFSRLISFFTARVARYVKRG